MAQIPVKQSSSYLSPATIQTRQYDTGMEQAINRLGEGIKTIGRAVENYGEKQKKVTDYKEQSEATLSFQEFSTQQRTRFANDDEQDINKYKEEMDKFIESSSKAIKDPLNRQKYIYKAKSSQLNLIADFTAEKEKKKTRQAKLNYENTFRVSSTDIKATTTMAERQVKIEQLKQSSYQAYEAGLITNEQYSQDIKQIQEELPVEIAVADVQRLPLDEVYNNIEKGVYGIVAEKKAEAIKKVEKEFKDLETINNYKQQVVMEENETSILENVLSIEDPQLAQEMQTKLKSGELLGQYSKKFVSSANSYLGNVKSRIGETKQDGNAKFGQMVEAMHVIVEDFKANKESVGLSLLDQIKEYRSRLIELGANGDLSSAQVLRLERDLTNIIRKPRGEALAMQEGKWFAKANRVFKEQLPIELVGEAQALYYEMTSGDEFQRLDFWNNKERHQEVIDDILQQVQEEKLSILDEIMVLQTSDTELQARAEEQGLDWEEVEEMLKNKEVTINQVREKLL